MYVLYNINLHALAHESQIVDFEINYFVTMAMSYFLYSIFYFYMISAN